MNFWKVLGLCLAVPSAFILCSANLAAAQDVKVCIEYETIFSDYLLGDYYDSQGPVDYPSIRPWVQVYDNDAESYIYNNYISSGNCTSTLWIPTTHDVNVKVLARANLGSDNRIFVKDDRTNQQLHAQVVAANWNPSVSDEYKFTYEYNATYKTSNVLAAVGRSIYYRPAGVSGIEIVYFTEGCDIGTQTGACYRYVDQHRVFLGSNSRGRKSTPTHETGHALANEMNERDGNTYNCQLDQDPCGYGTSGNDHCDLCLEWQSCAAWEGFADFYMIQSWNNKNGGDCEYDDDGTSCATGGNYIASIPCCTGAGCNGKGTESDWAHFWWDLYQAEDCSTANINQILTNSVPESWTPESSIYSMIRSGAFDYDLCETNWDYWASINGVNH